MPSVFLPISETDRPVSRTATLSVIQSLVHRTGLPENISILFPGQHGIAQLPGSAVTEQQSRATFGHSDRFQVEVTEEFVEDTTLTTAVRRTENVLVFSDPALEVSIKPVYATVEVSLSVTYRAVDRVSAERWRDQLRIGVSQGRAEQLHTLEYHYGLPHPFLYLLTEIHRRREAVAGYGETLKQWIRSHLSERATTLVTQAGTQPELVIAEQQVGVVGWFDFTVAPGKGQMDGDGAAVTTSVEYRYRYDKVVGCVMDYPLMVHNQLLPTKLRPKFDAPRLEDHPRNPSYSQYVFARHHDAVTPRAQSMLEGFAIPAFDEWYPEYQPAKVVSLLRAMLSVGDDPREVANLNHLGPYRIHPTIVAFLRREAPYLTQPYESPFLVTLFGWRRFREPEWLSINSDLQVRSTQDLTLREPQHLQLALIRDLANLSPGAKDRLKDWPDVVELIKDTLRPGNGLEVPTIGGRRPRPGDPDYPGGQTEPGGPGKGPYVPKRELDKIIDQLDERNRGQSIYDQRRMWTVGAYAIIAKQEKN